MARDQQTWAAAVRNGATKSTSHSVQEVKVGDPVCGRVRALCELGAIVDVVLDSGDGCNSHAGKITWTALLPCEQVGSALRVGDNVDGVRVASMDQASRRVVLELAPTVPALLASSSVPDSIFTGGSTELHSKLVDVAPALTPEPDRAAAGESVRKGCERERFDTAASRRKAYGAGGPPNARLVVELCGDRGVPVLLTEDVEAFGEAKAAALAPDRAISRAELEASWLLPIADVEENAFLRRWSAAVGLGLEAGVLPAATEPAPDQSADGDRESSPPGQDAQAHCRSGDSDLAGVDCGRVEEWINVSSRESPTRTPMQSDLTAETLYSRSGTAVGPNDDSQDVGSDGDSSDGFWELPHPAPDTATTVSCAQEAVASSGAGKMNAPGASSDTDESDDDLINAICAEAHRLAHEEEADKANSVPISCEAASAGARIGGLEKQAAFRSGCSRPQQRRR